MDPEDRSLFDGWIRDARAGQPDDADIARLAQTPAASGEPLQGTERSADLASAGGPGSISTLWSPAAIVAHGATVAKLGVSGRPAGGVDVLMQVEGYRTDLDAAGAEAVIERCGYVHLLAGDRFAPADTTMFAYRQRIGAQQIPALAIASLLSKKLATGTAVAGLEVREAPHGNFGADREEATRKARRFCKVARLLGITGICILTDATVPQQPYFGRGEALIALSHLLTGTECDWLATHARQCEEWSNMLVGAVGSCPTTICQAFENNIAARGGAIESLHERAKSVAAAHSRTVTAWDDGLVRYDLGGLRQAVLAARQPDRDLAFDDSAGLVILARPGSHLRRGDPIVSARCSDSAWQTLRRGIAAAIRLDRNENHDSAISGTVEMEVISV